MRELVLVFSMVYMVTATAVEKINIQANCWISGGANAVCEVCNYQFSQPMLCQMNVSGKTYRGFNFQGIQKGVVVPGQCMNGYVYANNPSFDPLIDAWANVNCRF